MSVCSIEETPTHFCEIDLSANLLKVDRMKIISASLSLNEEIS